MEFVHIGGSLHKRMKTQRMAREGGFYTFKTKKNKYVKNWQDRGVWEGVGGVIQPGLGPPFLP